MTTQYTPILKLALPVQGELSGTWGDTVNDNITSMVEEAIAGRSVINSWTTNSHTLTTADGTTAESRAMMLEFTDTGVALTGAGTVICPTASKIYICKNDAGQTVTIKTSAGTGVAIADGETKFVFCDGTNVVEAVTSIETLSTADLTATTADINGGTIDGTVIGGSSAAAGTFTSITGTSANINGTVTADGLTVQTTNGLNVLLESSNSYQYLQFKNTLETNNYLGFVGDDFSVTAANKKYLQVEGNGDISFYEDTGTTAKFFWDASAESLGIGTSSPSGKLTISEAAGFNAPTTVTAANTYLQLGSADYATNGKFMIGFGYTDGATNTHSPAYMGFDMTSSSGDTKGDLTFFTRNVTTDTAPTERMRIDSSGNLLVGTTDSDMSNNSGSAKGFSVLSGGIITNAAVSNPVYYANRLTSDGSIIEFRKDGTTVGSIGTEVSDGTTPADLVITAGTINAARLWLKGGDSGLILDGHTNSVLPTDENSYEDNRTDLGSGDYRFKDLYLSGGVYLGGTGAANKLDDYEEGTWTATSAVTLSPNSIPSYTKIGRLVHLVFDVTVAVNSNGADFNINQPFAGVTGEYGTGSINYNSSGSAIGAINIDGNAGIKIREAAQNANLTYAQLSGIRIIGSVTYVTSA